MRKDLWRGRHRRGFLKWGYPQIIQVMDDHFFVVKPMVTWSTPIFGNLHICIVDI